MILNTYLWKQPRDSDFLAPQIQLINKDLLSSYTV
jgi:hypothetical protein